MGIEPTTAMFKIRILATTPRRQVHTMNIEYLERGTRQTHLAILNKFGNKKIKVKNKMKYNFYLIYFTEFHIKKLLRI